MILGVRHTFIRLFMTRLPRLRKNVEILISKSETNSKHEIRMTETERVWQCDSKPSQKCQKLELRMNVKCREMPLPYDSLKVSRKFASFRSKKDF